MEHLYAPFVRLDKLIQKIVDRFVFFLMRRFGLSKSRINYVVMMPIIITLAIFARFFWINGKSVFALILIFTFLLYFFYQKFLTKKIEECEKVGKDDRKEKDTYLFVRVILFFDFVRQVVELFVIVTLTSSTSIVLATSLLFWVYLLNTPNTPPPKEQTVSELARDVV